MSVAVRSKSAAPFIDACWDESAIPTLVRFARIPNKSPAFDPEWEALGHMDKAVQLLVEWVHRTELPGATVAVKRLPGRTPLLSISVAGTGPGNVLLYGHLDKQPEMAGWREGLGPWSPVIDGDRLYARGIADDGYALFAYAIALKQLGREGRPYPRCTILIEACEESGSYDLSSYLVDLEAEIGDPSLVICLDAACGNYDQLWCTTSLRGMINGRLKVTMLDHGVHSGDASGIVPSTFRIQRCLLDRLEDASTGRLAPAIFGAPVPDSIARQARHTARIMKDDVHARFPLVAGAGPASSDPTELLLAGTWDATLSVIGAGGIPDLADAGNVLRANTVLALSIRTPPTLDACKAAHDVKALLERVPPYGAQVEFEVLTAENGWKSPDLTSETEELIDAASRAHFGQPAAYMGDGGSIPFIDMLGRRYPSAQFVITGLLGPGSNAHAPNEFMHIPSAKRLTACVADILAGHCLGRACPPDAGAKQ